MMNAVTGGLLIGLAAVWLYFSIGRVAGISGIFAAWFANPGRVSWQLLFLLGLGAGGWMTVWLVGREPVANLAGGQWLLLLAGGLLVGYGTRLGSGCTSGHGVCGIARLSLRSLVATCVFLAVGMLVATGVAGL